MPGGAATVQWDDEGVAPDEYALISEGVLVDYQTTRETASLLAPWYAAQGKPLRSHGCASAPSAHDLTLQHTPNLVLAPSADAKSFDDLIADTPKGIAVLGGTVDVDFQGRTGRGEGMLFEINRGKLGARLPYNLFMFETTELWRNLDARGGRASVERVSAPCVKGEPWQQTSYTVESVPAKVKNVSLIRA
jgi:TldD protein